MASLNFMKQSGFNMNKGMQYMAIYRAYLEREKKCKNDMAMWKLSHPVIRAVHKTMVQKIQSNNLYSANMYKLSNMNSFPTNNNMIFHQNNHYAMMTHQVQLARQQRKSQNMMAMYNRLMNIQNSKSMMYMKMHQSQQIAHQKMIMAQHRRHNQQMRYITMMARMKAQMAHQYLIAHQVALHKAQ